MGNVKTMCKISSKEPAATQIWATLGQVEHLFDYGATGCEYPVSLSHTIERPHLLGCKYVTTCATHKDKHTKLGKRSNAQANEPIGFNLHKAAKSTYST